MLLAGLLFNALKRQRWKIWPCIYGAQSTNGHLSLYWSLALYAILDTSPGPHLPPKKNSLSPTGFVRIFLSCFCMLRRSNVIPDSERFDASRCLRRCDFEFTPDRVTVIIRWSKTIQHGERILRITLTRTDTALCPYLALTNHFRITTNISKDGPAFVVAHSPPKPLTSAI